MNRDILKQMSNWMGFVGTMTIIIGILSAIGGLFAFLIGAVPGIITTILGFKLRSAKQAADQILAGSDDLVDSGQFNLLTADLGSYFKIQGILIIISLIMGLLAMLFTVIAGVSMYRYF